MKKKNKRGYENSFAWIFAIIAGATIIFLAIYAISNFIGMFKTLRGSESALEIGTLLTPFENSIEEGKLNIIKTREETEIYNDCVESGEFGTQKISVKVNSKIGKENIKGVPSGFKNRYLFSDDVLKGKEFYVLSKPFDFPFKIGDLIISWSKDKKYCFVDLRNYQDVKKDVEGGNFGNVVNTTSTRACDEESIKVCFANPNNDCNIIVGNNKVMHKEKNKEVFYTLFDEDLGLMYAAIFSDPEIYNCQIKRLAKRAVLLEKLYEQKASLSKSLGGCESIGYLGGELNEYELTMGEIATSENPNINNANMVVSSLEEKNVQNCELY